jgi:hypothetical protein
MTEGQTRTTRNEATLARRHLATILELYDGCADRFVTAARSPPPTTRRSPEEQEGCAFEGEQACVN